MASPRPSWRRVCTVAVVAALAGSSSAAFADMPSPRPSIPGKESALLSLPHEAYELENGLTVILHEDHRQPLVVVNVNVDVGSGDEPPRRTGFAHLFEHLMFMGTSRVPEKMFDVWMEAEGGWNNAWTSSDRTDYYDVGPSHILPLLLWMEADRLAVLGDEINQAKLDTQRGVVRNERRQQTEDQPYGKADLRLSELLFPVGHPYHHPTIGSHEDLEAATVADVQGFFRQWYVPRNMSLVIAGDFQPEPTKALVEKYFGPLKDRPVPPRAAIATPARLEAEVRETLEDTVSFPKIVMSWLSPKLYAEGDAELDLLGEILSNGKTSRLYKRLVYEERVAQSVSAYQGSRKRRSQFDIEIVVKPGTDLARVEAMVDEELARLRDEPIDPAELLRAKNQYEAGFIMRLQSLATRASLLNTYASSLGRPDGVAEDLQRYLDATPAALAAAARTVFDPNARVVMHVVPKKEGAEAAAAQ
ncbi:MAG: pitrilysin family protein [Myxococcota bacterium]